MQDADRTLKEFVNYGRLMIYECFRCTPLNHLTETYVLLLLYNNSEDAQFFHGFTGTLNHLLIDQSESMH